MTNFKSNLPKDFDLNKHYSPILSDYDKEVRSKKAKVNAATRDDKYYENLRNGIANRDNTYQAEVNSRPEVKAKHSQNHKGKPKSDAHKTSLKATTTNKPGDPNWEAAHKAGLAKRDKPFHAGKYGTFASIADATRQVEKTGQLVNAYKKFSKWKKENPKEYYFIEVNNDKF
jgi:hypothetical protein